MDEPELHWSQRATLDPASSYSSETPAAKQPRPRAIGRSRKTPIIWVVVACLVVAAGVAAFLLINAKNAAAAEQKAKAAALAQMGTYTDYSTGVSFPVPTSWEQIPLDDATAALSGVGGLGAMPSAFVAFGQGGLATGGSGPGAMMMFAAQDHPGGAAVSVKEILEVLVSRIEDIRPPGISVEGEVKEIEGAAIDGAEMIVKATAAGETAFMRFSFLDSGSCTYTFVFAADEYTWENSRYFFDGTVESFALVSAQ